MNIEKDDVVIMARSCMVALLNRSEDFYLKSHDPDEPLVSYCGDHPIMIGIIRQGNVFPIQRENDLDIFVKKEDVWRILDQIQVQSLRDRLKQAILKL